MTPSGLSYSELQSFRTAHPSEVPVLFSTIFKAEILVEGEIQPRPDSYDSGPECSLAHLLTLYRLVEEEKRELDGYVFDDSCLHIA